MRPTIFRTVWVPPVGTPAVELVGAAPHPQRVLMRVFPRGINLVLVSITPEPSELLIPNPPGPPLDVGSNVAAGAYGVTSFDPVQSFIVHTGEALMAQGAGTYVSVAVSEDFLDLARLHDIS